MRMNGRVKWFDSKKGYGFVETTGENKNDLFVHFSNIKTSDENIYKKLFPGEYVSFIRNHDENNNRDECTDVRGVDMGPLMTENTGYRYKVFKNYNYELVNESVNENVDPEIAEVLDDENENENEENTSAQ